MLLINFVNTTIQNLIYNPFDINVSLIYLLDIYTVVSLFSSAYIDLIIDMSEIFTLFIVISILYKAIFNLLIFTHQLVLSSENIIHMNIEKTKNKSNYVYKSYFIFLNNNKNRMYLNSN